MAQPSLKIKLRLSSPLDSKVSTPASSSSASSAPSSPKQPRSDSSTTTTTTTTEHPPKRSRVRSRKPVTTQSSLSNQPTESDVSTAGNLGDDQGTINRSQAPKPSPRIRAIFAHKDTPVRRWHTRPMTFYTLGGGQVQLPSGCWKSDESMKLNKRPTEPTSLADIDQLFTVEKDFRPFLCTHVGCSKSFTSFDLLQTHETNMHGIKKMVCGIDGCQKSFATSGQLTKHRKMVHFRAARKAKKLAEAEAEAAAAAAAIATSTTTTPATPVTMPTDEININDDEESS